MLLSQIDTQPYTIGATIPVAGVKLSKLLDPYGINFKYLHITPREPGSATYHKAFLYATGRPGATLIAADWASHAGYVGEGECWYLPFDLAGEVYIKPVAAEDCSVLLIVG